MFVRPKVLITKRNARQKIDQDALTDSRVFKLLMDALAIGNVNVSDAVMLCIVVVNYLVKVAL